MSKQTKYVEVLDQPGIDVLVDRNLLTEIQKRRYDRFTKDGLTRREICCQENVGRRAVTNTLREIVHKFNLDR